MIFPNKKKRVSQSITLLLALVMLVSTLVGGSAKAYASAVATASTFTDVETDDYFADAVQWAVERGIAFGTSATTFSPDENCTVAQVLAFLWRANGAPQATWGESFSAAEIGDYYDEEIGNDYYDVAVWAYKNGMISSGTFDGDTPCTRALAVTYMWKAAGSPVAEAVSFTDVSAEAEYADAVAWAVEQGVTSGTSAATFSPDDVCTRGQIVTFLYLWENASTDRTGTSFKVPGLEVFPQYDDDTPLIPANGAAPAAPAGTSSAALVNYTKKNYPDLKNIGYGTFAKLDYKETDSSYTYFYDFRKDWRASARRLEEADTSLTRNCQGYFGIIANADKNVVTCTLYTELDNAVLEAVEFRTYDDAERQEVAVAEDGSAKFSVKDLPNGPYTLCVWFDYTLKDGSVKTINAWTPVYVSNGNAYFARDVYKRDDATMKTWLAAQRNDLAADDVFQNWMSKHGGDNLDAALRTDNITYPYYSNTERYPNNTPKWKALAHEICPDEDTSDFSKARLVHDWMSHNLVYDKRQLNDAKGNRRDKYLGYRWAENGSGEWSTWNTHIGVCFDFANIYAIMCRELGVPCRIISDAAKNHCYNAVYLHGRWELVDLVDSCDSVYIENTKDALETFWANWEGPGHKADLALGFIVSAYQKYKIWDNEKDKYSTVEEKFAQFDPLDRDLCTKALLRSFGGKYNH